MKPLQPIPQCVDCLISMARDVIALANAENPSLIEEAGRISRDILADAADNGTSSPQIANRILREIRHLTGIEDPYADFKSREMAQARKIFSQLKHHAAENLRSHAKLAALGNSLDFFHNPVQALAELQSAKLEDRFDRVADTGTDGAGIDWDHVSKKFLDLFASADLIISKGMANFETLYPKSFSVPGFYLFKVKCEPIQNYIQAPVNSCMALWKDGN